MRKNIRAIFKAILSFSILFLSACQVNISLPAEVSPVAPTPTVTMVPTAEPTAAISIPQVINSQNAGKIKKVAEYQVNQPMQVTWLKDSQSFWVVNDTNAVRINIQNGQIENVFNAVNPGRILDASPDGDTILYLDQNQNEIRVFRQSINQTLMINPETIFENASFSPDGTKVSIPSLDELQVSIWDTQSGARLMTLKGFETAAPVYDAHIGADNHTLIWHSRASIQLQSLDSQLLGPRFSHEDFVMGFDLSQNGQVLATTAGGNINGVYSPVIYFWDAQSGAKLASVPFPDSINALAFSADGKLLAGASSGSLILVDASTHKVITIIQGLANSIDALAFSPDGRSLLSTSIEDNQIKLWQVHQ